MVQFLGTADSGGGDFLISVNFLSVSPAVKIMPVDTLFISFSFCVLFRGCFFQQWRLSAFHGILCEPLEKSFLNGSNAIYFTSL